MRRQCGDCNLCCKLIPVRELGKLANQRCEHQRRTGCAIYATRPASCAFWNCAWLTGAPHLRRPDRGHYVVDTMLDFVVLRDNATKEVRHRVPVVQVWVDPDYRAAFEADTDDDLLAYLAEEGKQGRAALVRFSSHDARMLWPPALTADGTWRWQDSNVKPEMQHTVEEIAAVAGANLL